MRKFLFFLIFLLFLCLFTWIWRGIYFPKSFKSAESKPFSVEKGQGFFQIAENLEKGGLIKNRFFFVFYLALKGGAGKLQSGEYLLSPSMSVVEISRKIVSGETVKEEITIIEGWNFRDIGFYLENKGMFQAEELWELAGFPAVDYSKAAELPVPKDFSKDCDFLKDKPQNLGLEGYLFPDTYQVKKGESLEEIVRKMLANFDKKLTPELREEIKRQNKTIFEIIIMGSLIEKEVRTIEDKKLVSGILWKRLTNNMPLQVDATVAYITGKKTTKISFEELKIDSPYNTYKYLGLPEGPISNPGLDSILAAVYPENSDYWFYLSTQGGETIFSKTLQEHNLAKSKYLP